MFFFRTAFPEGNLTIEIHLKDMASWTQVNKKLTCKYFKYSAVLF